MISDEEFQQRYLRDKVSADAFQQRYLQGKLTAEEEADFEAYFLDKPEIIEQLETQQAIREGFQNVATQFTATRGKRKMRRRSDRRARRKWMPAFAMGVAAGLVATILLNFDRGPKEAIANLPIVELGAVRSFGDQSAPVLALDSDLTMIAMKVQLQNATADSYVVHIRESGAQEALFRIDALVPHIYGAIVFALPSKALHGGRLYEVEVSSPTLADIELFRFEVAGKGR